MSDSRPLLVLQHAPYTGSLARAALDLTLSFAAFNQRPRVLFSGAGVLQLIEDQDPQAIGRKSLRKVIDSFPLYDIDEVLVEEASLTRRGITATQLPSFARLIGLAELREIRAAAASVLSL